VWVFFSTLKIRSENTQKRLLVFGNNIYIYIYIYIYIIYNIIPPIYRCCFCTTTVVPVFFFSAFPFALWCKIRLCFGCSTVALYRSQKFLFYIVSPYFIACYWMGGKKNCFRYCEYCITHTRISPSCTIILYSSPQYCCADTPSLPKPP